MENKEKNSEFLQSIEWRKFQESVGRKTVCFQNEGFLASVIEHSLPIVGKYFYVPRGPIFFAETKKNLKSEISNYDEIQNSISKDGLADELQKIINLAQKEKAGWIRFEPKDQKILEIFENIADTNGNKLKVVKAPHDMQPKEVFVVDISKSEEELLAGMKPKTRYNIKLAQKKGVIVSRQSSVLSQQEKYMEEFLRLTKEMAIRHGIVAHPEIYYRKMIESLPSEMLRIYVAQYEGKIIATNLVLFYGKTVTYLHGASGNEHRNVMAPFLLQWQAILDAKELGFEKYDFGGISTNYLPTGQASEKNTNVRTTNKNSSWRGITDFKLGFSPNTQPVEFPGSYDIIINPRKYAVYRGLQRAKGFLHKIRK